MMMIIVKAIAG